MFFPTFASAQTHVCEAVVNDRSYNLRPLDGPRSVVWVQDHPPAKTKTTFTISLCTGLKKLKGVPKHEDCPNGSRGETFSNGLFRHASPSFFSSSAPKIQSNKISLGYNLTLYVPVCAIERLYNSIENVNGTIEKAIGIAGEYMQTGEHLDAKWTRLKSSASHGDRQKDGLRLEMNGAKYPPDKTGLKQKAVVEFLCDAKEQERRRGLIAGINAREEDDKEDGDEDAEDPEAGEETDDGKGGKLKFLSYENVEGVMVLNLEWTTKYACEDAKKDPVSSSGHWGFFTWLIIM